MPKFSKDDLDSITTWTGVTAAVCFGISGMIVSAMSNVPGDKIMGIDKTPLTVISGIFAGVGATALSIKSVFTNKTATAHPTTADLEREASIQEQADYFRYSAQAPTSPSPLPQIPIVRGVGDLSYRTDNSRTGYPVMTTHDVNGRIHQPTEFDDQP